MGNEIQLRVIAHGGDIAKDKRHKIENPIYSDKVSTILAAVSAALPESSGALT